jgi:hypothetical protein
MQRRLKSTLVLMAAVAAASGCGDQQQQLPSAPEYHIITDTSSGCDSTHLKQLVNTYFTAPRQQVVRNLLSSMFAQVAFSSTAKNIGFDVLANMDTVVSSGVAGDSSVGSNLVNHLILCMYNPTSEAASYPATFPDTFTVALSPSLHGAFSVRGGTADAPKAPVLSRPVTNPFSGFGPPRHTLTLIPLTFDTTAWATMLGGNPAPKRVLVYGRPGSTSHSYNWKTLPHDAAFDPQAIVGVCLDALAAPNSQTVLNEENVGLLPFVDAYFLDPATCSSVALRNTGWGPTLAAKRLVKFGADLLSPRSLWATNALVDGLGGTTGGVRSEFGPLDVDHVTLQFVQQPTSTRVNSIITSQGGGPVTILATAVLTGGGTKPIPNVSIAVSAVNNNGVTVSLSGHATQITNSSGIAAYSDLSLNKTGGYRLTVTQAQVGGRPAIPVGSATSMRFNIGPAK